MRFRDFELDNEVFLAPMAGVTDLPFRLICKEHGCGLLYTEMINAKALCFDDEKTKKMLNINDEEFPVAVQIFGSECEYMARAAEILNDYPNEILDINMGCPAPKVVKNGDGSALMKKELNDSETTVIATGGLAKLICSETDVIDEVDSDLSLEGLRIIFEKNN